MKFLSAAQRSVVGDTTGLHGDFFIKGKATAADPFEAAVEKFRHGTKITQGISLDRPILSPEEWISDPYYSGPFAGEFFWPEKRRVFVEAAKKDVIEIGLTGATGVGKCLVAGTRVLDAVSGEYLRIEEMVGRPICVPSLNAAGEIAFCPAVAAQSGAKECARFVLTDGTSCEMSFDHPILTRSGSGVGWAPVGSLRVGDFIAVARDLPDPNLTRWSDAEVELAGHLIANGTLVDRTPQYTGRYEMAVRVAELATHVQGFSRLSGWQLHDSFVTFRLCGLKPWVQGLGIAHLSKEKQIPAAFFGLPTHQVRLLLNAIWTDGHIGSSAIELCLASERLIDDVQMLLRRLGIPARKKYKQARCGAKIFDAWRLSILAAGDRCRFFEQIGLICGMEARSEKNWAAAKVLIGNSNVDVVPIGYQDIKQIRKESGPWEKKFWASNFGLGPRSFMGRQRFAQLLQITKYQGALTEVLQPGLRWERLEKVQPIGAQTVYDLQVPGTENFIANGLVVHNSALVDAIALYDAYVFSCFTCPQSYFGFPPTSKLVYVFISVSRPKAVEKLFDPFKMAVDATPYFQSECCRDHERDSVVRFPSKNLEFRPAITSPAAILSEDVIGVAVTEANALPVIEESAHRRDSERYDVAQDIVNATYSRWESRFKRAGKIRLCRLVLDSSRQFPDDLVERREKLHQRGQLPVKSCYYSFSAWGARRGAVDAQGNPFFSGVEFPVLVGAGSRVSRILDPREVDQAKIGGSRIVWCAEEYRSIFETDLDRALRDLAGEAIEGLRPLIPNVSVLQRARRTEVAGFAPHQCAHPFTAWSTTLRDAVDVVRDMLVNPATGRPWVNPDKPRAIHADPGITGDAFGLSMAHVYDVVQIMRGPIDQVGPCLTCATRGRPGFIVCDRCVDGKVTHFRRRVDCRACSGEGWVLCPACRGSARAGTPVERVRTYLDFSLRIVPGKSGRVQFDDVEALISRMRGFGFLIPVVTADGHQSEQFLARQRTVFGAAIAEPLSVDKSKAPYYEVRDALNDVADDGLPRLLIYEYPPLESELARVEDRRDKIDHPRTGTKDVGDSLAGAVHNCETRAFMRESIDVGGVEIIRPR